jgi:PAS domain S-box-containing protein
LSQVDSTYTAAACDRHTLEASVATLSNEVRELRDRLDHRRERFDATITAMGDSVCVLDSHGVIVSANPAAESLLRAGPSGLEGRDLGGLVSGDWPIERERRTSLVELRQAINLGSSCRYDDARFMTLDRQWVPVSFVLTPIVGEADLNGSVLVFRDIRALKVSDLALRQSESQFRTIFEMAAIAIVTMTPEGILTECNTAYCEMLKDTRNNLVGGSWVSRMHPSDVDDSVRRFTKARDAHSSTTKVAERRYVTPDGEIVCAAQTASFVRDEEGVPTLAIVVAQDITDRKKLESSLRQAQKLEAVGRLAAGIAHEINTPVQFVGDSVHFVRDSLSDVFELLARYQRLRDAAASWAPELAEEISVAEQDADVGYLAQHIPRSLDRCLDGLDRVATIVRGMKDFGHPDQKEMESADLNRALGATLAIARNEYKYVADIETEFAELPPITCHVGELNQVFLNIIVNAAHAIGDVVRGTDNKGLIRIRTWSESASVIVAISDTGSGIPESVRDKIFDPFFTTKEVGRGTGQGLAIAHAVIVDKHGGEITFETEMGRGTTFFLRLPVQPPAAESSRDEAHPIC